MIRGHWRTGGSTPQLAVMLTAAGYHTTTNTTTDTTTDAMGAGTAGGPVPRLDPAVQVQLVVDLATLAGLADHPAELPGYGPTVRYATTKLKDYLKARDRDCTFPGCRQPTTRCDTDHQPPWRADGTGGHTSARDLAMLCEQHHQWKTQRLWQLTRGPDGTSIWTSRTGRTYQPPDHPPSTTPTHPKCRDSPPIRGATHPNPTTTHRPSD